MDAKEFMRKNEEDRRGPKTGAGQTVPLDSLVRPGDRLVISIKFLDPDEFGDEENTHQEIVLEDFLQSAESPDWDAEIIRIERSNEKDEVQDEV